MQFSAIKYHDAALNIRGMSIGTQAIWITVLVTLKIVLAGIASLTIGTEKTLSLSIALDLLFLTVGNLYSRALVVTYLYTCILCLSLYLSYHFEGIGKFTAGGDDQIYYDNFILLFNSFGIIDEYNSMGRTDLTTLLMVVASAPFRLVGFDFRSPVDYFLLQSSCLAPLGPLIKNISEKICKRRIGLLLFFAFTPYWYYGIVGREWPLYYISLLVTSIFISNNRSIIKLLVILIYFYLSFLVRFESVIIFGIFMLFHIRQKSFFLFMAACLALSLVYNFEYIRELNDFAVNKSQLIYFSNIEQSSGFGGALKYSDSIFIKPIFIIYLVFSPIPPYFYHSQTLENVLLLNGHLMWPIFILIIAFRFNRFKSLLVNSVPIRSAFASFSVVIIIMAFYGGTNRHYYPFIPHLFLAIPLLFSTQISFFQALKLPVLGIAFLSSLYIGLSVIL